MKGSADSYDAAMQAAGKYPQRVNPLRQAIPLLEKMKDQSLLCQKRLSGKLDNIFNNKWHGKL